MLKSCFVHYAKGDGMERDESNFRLIPLSFNQGGVVLMPKLRFSNIQSYKGLIILLILVVAFGVHHSFNEMRRASERDERENMQKERDEQSGY